MFKGVIVPQGPCVFSLLQKSSFFSAEHRIAFSNTELCLRNTISRSVLSLVFPETLIQKRLKSRRD